MNKSYKAIILLLIIILCGSIQANEITSFSQKNDIVKIDPPIEKSDAKGLADIGSITQIQGKLILGQKEWVHFPDINQSFRARVDTGAATSSLDADELKIVIKNGKKWAHFRIADKYKSSEEIVLPVKRWVRIKQASNEEGSRRPVIETWVKIGERVNKTEFTLADRSHLLFPVLLGRSYIKNNALVDVSRQYVQGHSR